MKRYQVHARHSREGFGLPQSNVPYILRKVDRGEWEGGWKGWGEGKEWELRVVYIMKQFFFFFLKNK